MSTYAKLDAEILRAITARRNPLYSAPCATEAKQIAEATGREEFRVIDGRLQSMRKAGRIRHMTKAESNGLGGWHVVGNT